MYLCMFVILHLRAVRSFRILKCVVVFASSQSGGWLIWRCAGRLVCLVATPLGFPVMGVVNENYWANEIHDILVVTRHAQVSR